MAHHRLRTEPGDLAGMLADLVSPRGKAASVFDTPHAAHLGPDLSDDQIVTAMDAAYRPDVGQFRRGEVGAWRDEMPAEIADFINNQRADVVRRWGYAVN